MNRRHIAHVVKARRILKGVNRLTCKLHTRPNAIIGKLRLRIEGFFLPRWVTLESEAALRANNGSSDHDRERWPANVLLWLITRLITYRGKITEFWLAETEGIFLHHESNLVINKHLMTGHKGNSEFCFPETLNVPRGEAEENIKVRGETKLTVSRGASH